MRCLQWQSTGSVFSASLALESAASESVVPLDSSGIASTALSASPLLLKSSTKALFALPPRPPPPPPPASLGLGAAWNFQWPGPAHRWPTRSICCAFWCTASSALWPCSMSRSPSCSAT